MGWYEDWQRQNLAFTPRMDQGGGEYTGYIKDVYEGDDAQPGQEFFPGPDLNQQARMGMRTPLDIAAARKVNGRYGSGSPGAQALMSAGQYQKLGDSPNVGNLDYQQNLREPAGVATGNSGGGAGAIASGDARPWDWGQGALDFFQQPNILSKTVEGLGRSTAISDTVDRLPNNALNDYVTQAQQSDKVGELLTPAFQAADQFGNLITDAGKFDYMGADYGAMGSQLKKDFSSVLGNPALAKAAQRIREGFNTGTDKVSGFVDDQVKLYGDYYGDLLGQLISKVSGRGETEPTRDWSTLNSGPFNPQGGQFEDFTGEGRSAVANPLMGNSVITPQDQSWSGGFMDQPPGRGLDKAGWLEKSSLGQMFRDKSETSDIVDEYSPDNINPITGQPRQTAKEKLTSLGEGMHSVAGDAVDWTADHARGAGLASVGGAGVNWAYNRTDMGKLKTQLKNADTDFARKNIQARINEKKAQRRAKFKKDHLPKGARNFNTTKLLAVVGGLAFGLGMADFVLAAGGGDEDVATEWAMDFVDNNPGIMKGIEAGTQLLDPIGTALGGSELLSNRMGPASENYWATPGFGSADGAIDPNWRN